MASIGGAIARGLETGWALGRQREQDIEARRQREVLERRQAAEDALAAEDRALRRQAAGAAEQRAIAAERRAATEYRLRGLKGAMEATGTEVSEIETEAKARTAGGQEIPPELGARYGDAKTRAQAVRQQYLNLASRIQSGEVDIDTVPPKELSAMLAMTTGYKPAELQAVPGAIKDFQAAMDTQNMGLATESLNTLLAPLLKRGIGEPSAHGGNITSKQIIRVLPAQDANGQVAPGMVYPVIRVFTDQKGPDGRELYYDAPLTQNGSTEDGDRIVPVSVEKFMGQLGNLGVLTTALSRPGLAERKAQGDKEAEAEINGYLDSLRAVSRPKRVLKREQVQLGDRVLEREVDESGRVLRERVLQRGAAPRVFAPGAGGGAGVPGATLSDKYNKDERYAQQVDYWAQLVADGGTLPPRFAQSGAGKEMFSDIVQRVPELGGDPRAMLAAQAEGAGEKAGARAAGTRAAAFALAKSEAYEMADLVTQTSAAVGRTQFQPINKALNAFNTNTGDPKIREFGAALNSFINAYARAVSPVGAPTVSDKEHAREMLSTADSHEQVQAIIGQLKREMEAAGRAPEVVREQQRATIRGGRGRPAEQPIAGGRGGAAPRGGPPAGARTATNPKTGERLYERAPGEWVPY